MKTMHRFFTQEDIHFIKLTGFTKQTSLSRKYIGVTILVLKLVLVELPHFSSIRFFFTVVYIRLSSTHMKLRLLLMVTIAC